MIFFIFLLGLSTGSFINVLESRLYRGEDFLRLPSHCDFCRKKLRWLDMIPVLSWVWYGGKSRCCHKKLSWQYPVVELLTGVGFVTIYLRDSMVQLLNCSIAGNNPIICFFNNRTIEQSNNVVVFIFYAVIFILAFTIFLQDIKYQAIHEKLLQLLIAITLILNFKFVIFNENFSIISKFLILNSKFIQHILVAIIASLPFYLLYKLSRERWLGEGDVWLASWMGLFLGFPRIFWAMYFGLILGGLISLIVVVLKLKKLRDTISLGPFLLIGTVISLFI